MVLSGNYGIRRLVTTAYRDFKAFDQEHGSKALYVFPFRKPVHRNPVIFFQQSEVIALWNTQYFKYTATGLHFTDQPGFISADVIGPGHFVTGQDQFIIRQQFDEAGPGISGKKGS